MEFETRRTETPSLNKPFFDSEVEVTVEIPRRYIPLSHFG